jgi:hypothetical protein
MGEIGLERCRRLFPGSLGNTDKRSFSRKTTRKPREKGGVKNPIVIGFAEVRRNLERPPAKVCSVWEGVSPGLREVAEVDRLSKRNAA